MKFIICGKDKVKKEKRVSEKDVRRKKGVERNIIQNTIKIYKREGN